MKTSTLVKTITAAAVAFTFIAAVSIQPANALDSAVNTRASAKGRYLDNDSRVGAEKQRFESQNVGAGSNGSATYTGSAYKQPRASVKGPYLNNDNGTQAEKVLSGWARFQR